MDRLIERSPAKNRYARFVDARPIAHIAAAANYELTSLYKSNPGGWSPDQLGRAMNLQAV